MNGAALAKLPGFLLSEYLYNKEILLALIEQAGQSEVVYLGTVSVISKVELEASWIEVLVYAGSVEPVVADASREVEIEVLHTEVVSLVVKLALKLLLSQLAERRYSVGDITSGDGRLGWSHQVGTLQ